MLNRRSVIKSAGALAVMGLPLWARVDSVRAATDSTYLDLSATLTGIDELELPVLQDDFSLSDLFRSVCNAASSESLEQLEEAYIQLVNAAMPSDKIAISLLQYSTQARPDATGMMARLTYQMWLYGIWYGGTEVANMPDSALFMSEDYQTDFMVSSRAYKNSWIWKIGQAHPMGDSNFNYGSWGDVPPSLTDFLGDGT